MHDQGPLRTPGRVGSSISLSCHRRARYGPGDSNCIALDEENDVYIAGHASPSYPTTSGAYDRSYNGGYEGWDDAAISRLNPQLTTLKASTFLGGNGFDWATSIRIDSEGRVFVAGVTDSENFPTTWNAYDCTHNGNFDAFASQFDSTLSNLQYASYLGGTQREWGVSLLVSDSDEFYLAGQTASIGFPVTLDAYDSHHEGNACDIFVSKITMNQFTRICDGIVVNDGGFSFGVSWIDYDTDNCLDLFVANWEYDVKGETNYLYHNNGDGTYTKLTTGEITADGNAIASTWGDFDNDGDLDAYVVNAQQNNYFYTNEGGGIFTKVTHSPVVEGSEMSMGAAWVDYDNDGWLDLFVVNHRPPSEPSGVENDLYRNDQGHFIRQDNASIGLIEDEGNSAAWGDYDGDGNLDLFLTRNDNLSRLFQNGGDGTFTQITSGALVSENTHAGNWADYDNDGDLDLFTTGGYPSPIRLYENLGNGTFERVTGQDIVNDSGYWVSGHWGDYDNDGDLDLFVSGHHFSEAHANRLYQNNGDGTFTRITTGAIATDVEPSHAGAWGDYDRDGDLDLFVANGNGENNILYKNNGNSNNWIHIKCLGTISNRSAIGAKVWVKATLGGITVCQLREVSSQSGFFSQSSLNAHFGLGDATSIDSLKIEWPSGMVDMLTNVDANQFLIITEGEYGDLDGDGIADVNDNCPDTSNPEQEDSDTDGVGDVCDNCPEHVNSDQLDGDNDSIGDVCDLCTDTDGDGYGDPGCPGNTCDEDNCPETYNPDQTPAEAGDINCQGGINVLDVLTVVKHILGTSRLVGAPFDRADCNCDGSVNVLDALSIVNIILGTIPECPGGGYKPEVTPEVVVFCESLKSYLALEDFDQFMTLVKAEMNAPTTYHLFQNYPNPFNPETTIRFTVSHTSPVVLAIYNIRGDLIRTLVNSIKETGNHSVRWNGTDEGGNRVGSGIYFCQLSIQGYRQTKKMLLLK